MYTTVREGVGPACRVCAALDCPDMLLGPPREKRPDILNGLIIDRFTGDYD